MSRLWRALFLTTAFWLTLCALATAQAAIVPLFDDHARFSEGLAAVQVNGKWGYVDSSGRFAIQPQYTEENGFDELHKNGELAFHEGRAPIKLQGKWGFIDKSGTVAVAPQFDDVRPFSNGVAAVLINNKWGYIDPDGKMVIAPQFDFGGPFQEELALIMTDKGTATAWAPWLFILKRPRQEYAYIGKSGAPVIMGPFDDVNPVPWTPYDSKSHLAVALVAAKVSSFSEGLAGVRTKAGALGYIDRQGQQVIKLGRDIASLAPFHNGTAVLTDKRQKNLAIDKTGKILTSLRYAYLGNFTRDGLAIAAEAKNKYGYVDATYRFVILPQFQDAGAFCDGLAPVKLDGKWRYIDTAGRVVNDLAFENASEFCNGVAFVKRQGKYALIDTNFDSVLVLNE